MTLTQKISQLEQMPTPQGFIDLRLYVNDLEAEQKKKDNDVADTFTELWATLHKINSAVRADFVAAEPLIEEAIALIKRHI